MNYEVLEDSTGLKFCVFNADAAVGRNPEEERIVFERIFQKKNMEYYHCPYCVYMAIGQKYDVLFKDISVLRETKRGLYFGLGDGEYIPINKQTFSIRCTLNECKFPEVWVKIYKPQK